MSWKSNADRYGRVALILHWLSAFLILGLMLAGVRAAGTVDPSAKATILRLHAPIGVLVLLLTIARLIWFLTADRRPKAVAMPGWQRLASKAVHGILYVAIIGLAGSGMALMAMSGAANVIFGSSPGPLPDFWNYAPRYGHAAFARLMWLLLAAHVGAALYHQFVRRDRLLARMGIGR